MYEKIELIGKGGFGTVYKVQNKKTNEYFAAKVLDKKLVQTKTKGFMSLKNEIKILRILDSEYLVKMEGMFESSPELIILMELLEGGTLYSKFRSFNAFSEKQAAIYINNIL